MTTGEIRPLTPISVVVCARDGADQLRRCLEGLIALDYPEYEIIVVDSAPHSGQTAQLVARLPVRYVHEVRPGLSWARNAGIAEAHFDLVAFIDDGVCPERGWLRAIGAAFEEPEVMAVSGPIAPAGQNGGDLGYGGVGGGLHRKVIKGAELTARELLQAGEFGAGANMAFRRELFNAVGPFDVALGVGTSCGGGGVVEMLHRLLARGYTLVYEPGALVRQTWPRDMAALRRSAYDKGRACGAYLFTCARKRTVSRLSILHYAVRGWLGGRLLRRLCVPGGLPRHLVVLELAGALLSPLAYRAARARARYIVTATSAGAHAPGAQVPHTDSYG